MNVALIRPMKFDQFHRGRKEFHRPKTGFYCHCGADLNPHHATKTDQWTAKANGYLPCPDCFPNQTDNTGETD